MSDADQSFDRAAEARPASIDGTETGAELLASAVPAFVGRQVRRAFELMTATTADDISAFMTLSGAMPPAGLHRSCSIPNAPC